MSSSSSQPEHIVLPHRSLAAAIVAAVDGLGHPANDPLRELVEIHEPYKEKIDPEAKGRIYTGLIKKKMKFGEFYCPCKLQNIPDNICRPCVEYQTTGHCHCGLFK